MYYFGYGMNTNLIGMKNRCPKSKSLGAAKLLEHKLRFAIWADIIQQPLSTVNGVLWEITNDCLERLDILEGYPNFYDRKIVKIEFNHNIYNAWVYFMQPNNNSNPPPDYYFNEVKTGYEQHLVDTKQLYEALELSKQT